MWSTSLNQSTEVIPASLVLHNSNTNLYLLSEIVPVNTGLSPSLNFKVTLLISTTSISCFCTGLVGFIVFIAGTNIDFLSCPTLIVFTFSPFT